MKMLRSCNCYLFQEEYREDDVEQDLEWNQNRKANSVGHLCLVVVVLQDRQSGKQQRHKAEEHHTRKQVDVLKQETTYPSLLMFKHYTKAYENTVRSTWGV